MKNLIDSINSKIDYLNYNIEDLLEQELNVIIQNIKTNFKNKSQESIDQYIENLNNLFNIKKTLSTHILPYNYNSYLNSSDQKSDLIDLEDAITTSGNVYNKPSIEKIGSNPLTYSNIPTNSYYFYNSNSNYGETNNLLKLNYKLTPLEDFNLFPLKISGLKLFDNIFLAQTFRDSMIKLFSFLFMLNEKPFIEICNLDYSQFSSSSTKMKKPIMLKQNECYFESNVDEIEAVDMIKTFLKHININLKSCKVLLNCSIDSSNQNETYVTVIL